MAITYTWNVKGMLVKDENNFEDVVVQTYWTKTGVDENGNEGVFTGATPIKLSSNSQSFVEYSNLTQNTVLSWITPLVDNTHVNLQIQKQIDSKKNPLKNAELPWNQANNNANT